MYVTPPVYYVFDAMQQLNTTYWQYENMEQMINTSLFLFYICILGVVIICKFFFVLLFRTVKVRQLVLLTYVLINFNKWPYIIILCSLLFFHINEFNLIQTYFLKEIIMILLKKYNCFTFKVHINYLVGTMQNYKSFGQKLCAILKLLFKLLILK